MSLLLLLSGSVIAPPGSVFKATAQWNASGLVGTIGVTIKDGATVITPRTTSGIIEHPAGSKEYIASLTAPTTGTYYQILFDDGTNYAIQDLTLLDLSVLNLNVAGSVTYVGPVATSGNVEIVHGDDYNNTDGRALEWTSTGWPDLTGATIGFAAADGAITLTKAGSVVTPTGTAKVRVELTATDTTIRPGTYWFDVQATLASTRKVTLVRGRMTVLGDLAA